MLGAGASNSEEPQTCPPGAHRQCCGGSCQDACPAGAQCVMDQCPEPVVARVMCLRLSGSEGAEKRAHLD